MKNWLKAIGILGGVVSGRCGPSSSGFTYHPGLTSCDSNSAHIWVRATFGIKKTLDELDAIEARLREAEVKMAFQYTKARRENTHLLIGLIGPSGAGKTFSAMQLATGLSDGLPFLLLDSEDRRGLYYAERFDFEHRELNAPFTPDKYRAAVLKGAADGFGCIVIDSMSNEWEDTGGVVEMAVADKSKPPGNWIKPKQAHHRMVRGFLQVGVNLIFCLRAYEKMDASSDDSAKLIIKKPEGLQPVCEKRFPYELTPRLSLSNVAPGVVDLSLPNKIIEDHRMILPPGQHISVEAGRLLGQWARGDAVETPDTDLWRRARLAAQQGMDALRAFSAALSSGDQAKLKPIKEELLAAGNQADRNLAGGVASESGFITEDQVLDLETLLSRSRQSLAHCFSRQHICVAGFAKSDSSLLIFREPYARSSSGSSHDDQEIVIRLLARQIRANRFVQWAEGATPCYG